MTYKRKQICQRKRDRILKRDNFTCQNCGAKGDFNALEIDHIIPVTKGGDNSDGNLQTLCWKCNTKKNNKIMKSIGYLSPRQKLQLFEEKCKEYSDLDYDEFLFMCLHDRTLNITAPNSTLNLWKKYTNNQIEIGSENSKRRDEWLRAAILLLVDKFSMTYRELAQEMNQVGKVKISHMSVGHIINRENNK